MNPLSREQSAHRAFQVWSRPDSLAALLLILPVILVYLPVWHAGFLWDDDNHVTANACIIGPLGLKEIWTTDNARFFPLTLTSYWLIHAAWGLHPLAYHLANVAQHAASAVVLWRVLLRLGVPGAWIGAALWALHPVMVESVAWIAELKNTQSALFYLLAILFFLRWRTAAGAGESRWNYALSLLFGVMAMASKSSTVVLPLVLGLCAWWLDGRWRWRNLLDLTPFFLMTAVVSLLTVFAVHVENRVNYDPLLLAPRSLPERFVTAGNVIWFYLGKLFWPHPLMTVYPRWELHPGQLASYLPTGAAAVTLLILWWERRGWSRPFLFAFAYFVTALLPVLGLVSHNFLLFSFVADHMQYLAAIGPLALAGAGLSRFADFARPLGAWPRPVLFAGALLILGITSWQRSWVYEDNRTLWRDAVAKNPACWVGYGNLGAVELGEGHLDEAISDFRQALKLHPVYSEAYLHLGDAFAARRQWDAAMSAYAQSVKLNPGFDLAYSNLGHVLFLQGKTDAAIDWYLKALVIGSGRALSHDRLAEALLQKGLIDQAIIEYQRALRNEPSDQAGRVALGVVYAKSGHLDAAIATFRDALQVDPNRADVHNDVANTLLQKGLAEEAVTEYQKAIEIDPGNVPTHSNLGALYYRQGQWDAALAQFQNVLALDPKNDLAHYCLGLVYAKKGNVAQATAEYQKALAINPNNALARAKLSGPPAPAPPGR